MMKSQSGLSWSVSFCSFLLGHSPLAPLLIWCFAASVEWYKSQGQAVNAHADQAAAMIRLFLLRCPPHNVAASFMGFLPNFLQSMAQPANHPTEADVFWQA